MQEQFPQFQFQVEDQILLIPIALGALLTFAGSVWLVVRAFQVHVAWGLAALFGCGLGQLVFLFAHFKRAAPPTLLALAGVTIMAVPVGIVGLRGAKIQDTAQTQEVGRGGPGAADETEVKEQRITLTGAKREEYAKLKLSRTWAVVQWANKDVTDADVELLHGCTLVRELDLSDTQVTDEGLHVLEDFEKLERLVLARTGVTEAGFKEHIEPIVTLMELDLRGTKVPGKLARDWQAKVPGRKLLR